MTAVRTLAVSRDTRERCTIFYVSYVNTPDKRELVELPNPMDSDESTQFTITPGSRFVKF